jgi:hypothetical protein
MILVQSADTHAAAALRLSLDRRFRCLKMPFFFFSPDSDSTLLTDEERWIEPPDIGPRKDDGGPALSFRRGDVIEDVFEFERGSGIEFERLGEGETTGLVGGKGW